MGLCIIEKRGGMKTYLFNNGVFKIQPTTNNFSVTPSGLIMSGSSTQFNLEIPYVATNKKIFVEMVCLSQSNKYGGLLINNGTHNLAIGGQVNATLYQLDVGMAYTISIDADTKVVLRSIYAGTYGSPYGEYRISKIWIE